MSRAVREDLSAENRVIAMTGIIARVADPLGHYWRTVAFQPGSVAPYNPVLHSGWPVDLDSPGTHDEIPKAVAIHSDNSIYVTGQTSRTNGWEEFTTVRYKPIGGSNPVLWRHNWSLAEVKPASGVDIVLDRSGDAYATGYMLDNGVDYATIAIRKDAGSGGNAQVKWDHLWGQIANNTDDRAKSISLTYEVDNGALVPFVLGG